MISSSNSFQTDEFFADDASVQNTSRLRVINVFMDFEEPCNDSIDGGLSFPRGYVTAYSRLL